jgi:transglutaminase-like putative cysteine protease
MKSQISRKYKLYNIDPRTRKVWFDAPSQENNRELLDTELESLPSGVIRQEIRFLDFPTRYIFSLPNLIMLTSEEGLFENVFRDYAETCFILPPRTLRNYVAYSLPKRREPNESDAVGSNNAFTHIPPSLNKERLGALASKISGKAFTSFEKARRIESFLINEYQYTLKVGALRSENPIEDFLFSLKAGHCELFATGMIMLLRTQNTPCRLAFGFHGGKYQEERNTFTIRQSDAHTWVEVFDPREGWQRFDPTPPAPMTIYADRLYFKKLFDFFVTLSEKWENFTFGYNNQYQIELVRTIMGSFKKEVGKTFAPLITKIRQSRALARLIQNFRHPFILGFTALLLILNIFVIRVYLRFKRSRTRETGIPRFLLSQRRASHWYHILVKTIAGRDVEKPAQDTPREFILSIGAHYQIPHELLSESSRTFYALRFGPKQNISGLIKYFTHLLKDIRNAREAGKE